MDPSASTHAQRNEPPGSAWNAALSPTSTRCSSTTIHPRPGTGNMARTLSAQRDGKQSESPPHSCGAALNEELLSTNCSKASVSSRKRAGLPPRSGWCFSASLRYARRTSARLDVEQRPRTACGLVALGGGADAIRPIGTFGAPLPADRTRAKLRSDRDRETRHVSSRDHWAATWHRTKKITRRTVGHSGLANPMAALK